MGGLRRDAATLGALLTAALLVGACTPDQPPTTADPTPVATATPTPTPTIAPPVEVDEPCRQDLELARTSSGEVRFSAGPGEWHGYNSAVSAADGVYDDLIAAQLFSGFVYRGSDGTVCDNTEHGTMEILSEEPFTVTYTIDESAVWSDGTPVTIDDYLLDWVTRNPAFLVDWAAQHPEYLLDAPSDPEGEPSTDPGEEPLEPPAEDEVPQAAPRVFDREPAEPPAINSTEGPQGEPGAKQFTLTFDAPTSDWKTFFSAPLPAHVAATQAGLAPEALSTAILQRDAATVAGVAEFWNTGWLHEPGELPDDPGEVLPSSGPYRIAVDGWQAGEELRLEANPSFGGAPAATENLVFRFLPDDELAEALENGEVDVIAPPPTTDAVPQLEAIGPAVNVLQYSTLVSDRLEFSFDAESTFGHPSTGRALREAFAHCIPRRQIVETLVMPVNADAVAPNARLVLPFQDHYDAVVGVAYDDRFDEVDIAASQELVAEAGARVPVEVRVGYRLDDLRQARVVELVADSCKDAGFEVIDAASPSFPDEELSGGEFDVVLTTSTGSGRLSTEADGYRTGGVGNLTGYSNAKVYEAAEILASSPDPAEQLKQAAIIETELWNDLSGVPLYAHPGVSAYDATLKNVRETATADLVSWNASQWLR